MLRLLSPIERWVATPGTESSVDITVVNDSTLAEDIEIEALGARAEWCRVEPAAVTVPPGGHAEVRFTVTVPAEATGGAEPHRLLLRARCLSDAAVLALEVRLVPLSAVLEPPLVRTAGSATAELRLRKLPTPGYAAPLRVGLRALPDGSSLRVTVPSQAVEVGEAMVTVPVVLQAANAAGPVGYRVEATAAGHPPVIVEGQVVHTGTPVWLPLLVTLVILLVTLGAVLLWGPEITPRPY